ncbi:MAG TPA: plasma-membrane proton-efflux P-type ATPase [Patescibacteria group bacterium]|nr:plasma-membrane proton-efflux P-type ATPase [Patescibacteria group bacterium]
MDQGLSSIAAKELLAKNGFNEIPQKHISIFKKILKNLISPIAVMLLLASFLSFILQKTFDGYFILLLLFLNTGITLWQENKADNAIQKLNEHLNQKVKVLRDNVWVQIDSRFLVIGDVVKLASGEVIPADAKIVGEEHLSINESALTGESLPKDKKINDEVFSGSFVASGIATIKVTAVGTNTHFGKTLFSVENIKKQSSLEKDILSISKFLTLLSLTAVVVLSVYFIIHKAPILELLTLDLSLVIAGIPISLPTVMTLIIEFGVINLAKKNVIIRRLSALEDLANVNFLLTDKTGTLTKNKIVVSDIYAYDGFTHNDVLSLSSIISGLESDNPIDIAINEKLKELHLNIPKFIKKDFIPADSKRKRSTVFIQKENKDQVISIGAPQIIISLCKIDKKTLDKFNREVETLAQKGFRTLAIASGDGKKENNLKIVGLIALSDELRPDAKSVLNFLKQNGINSSIVTGDNRAIAENISRELELNGEIITKDKLDKTNFDAISPAFFENTAAFAEILPEDKLDLVEKAKKFFTVAANGDGVNDLPAVKAASVGMAVSNAVSVLKATADIVLLSAGISVIKDAILESRKIFERLYTYSLYRISESLRLIVTIAVLGISYGVYPLTALQLILAALLNDIPIISLAFDNVEIANSPAKIDVKKRFTLSSAFGLVGVLNSLILFFIMKNVWNLSWPVIQTMYFLKLTVSGHMLIYVAHTKKHWWNFLPSKQVVIATSLTQLVATLFAFFGFLMPGKISLTQILFVWVWALLWMQVGEIVKFIQEKSFK